MRQHRKEVLLNPNQLQERTKVLLLEIYARVCLCTCVCLEDNSLFRLIASFQFTNMDSASVGKLGPIERLHSTYIPFFGMFVGGLQHYMTLICL